MINEYQIKQEICEIGRRIYAKGFAAANDGNITVKINDNEVLCTPTMVSKGFLKPDDICKVDMRGNQLEGRKKRTSEILLHLELFKDDPTMMAVVHCHPPHATAFSIAGEDIPSCVLPEVEIFLGIVPTAVYENPGCQEFADTIRPFVGKANTVVLKNHGTISWGRTLEEAYFRTEILDAYCRMLYIAKGLGRVQRIDESHVKGLLELKEQLGYEGDPRKMQNADLCVNTEFGRGYNGGSNGGRSSVPTTQHVVTGTTAQPPQPAPAATTRPSAGGSAPANLEALIKTVTDEVMAVLK
ncbi:MAG: class II aldolase/adducin family protein [Phycisphaerae bacterium]|nr:class II aldolase/adducin family protein [Phycisphaerae bacterium]